jgi:hypothetical protein
MVEGNELKIMTSSSPSRASSLLNFIKMYYLVQKLIRGQIQTQRQKSNLRSLPSSFRKESELKLMLKEFEIV